jgi:NAD(P)-dependent dehydrogenase (short-subunit alcohol dehydrogenase family)
VLPLRPDGSYLITGGLGGLGLLVARWLVERGVRHLVLMGRTEASPDAAAVITDLRRAGADVVVAQGDVGREDQLRDLLREIAQTLPPLRGIIHAAGVFAPGALLQQNWEQFARVLAPKVEGAWNLHLLTRDLPLDFFVLFSSAASLLGAAGHGSYAAANAFLDALAHQRRNLRLPALSINWGVWTEVGVAAVANADRRISQQGVGTISPRQGLQFLERLLCHAPAQMGVMPADWPKLVHRLAYTGELPFFAGLVSGPALPENCPVPLPPAGASLPPWKDAPPKKRRQLLLEYVRTQVASVLGLKPGQPVRDKQPLMEMGFDSLMALELRTRLQAGLATDRLLPATLVFDYGTVAALTEYLGRHVLGLELPGGSPTGPLTANNHPPDILDRLEQLSDEEVDHMLALRARQRD